VLNFKTWPERIYNHITAMGFSAMFTFQLDNTKSCRYLQACTNWFRGDDKLKFVLIDGFQILEFFSSLLSIFLLDQLTYPNLNFLQNVVLHQKYPTLSVDSFWKIGKGQLISE
jgi:hypothetical protein